MRKWPRNAPLILVSVALLLLSLRDATAQPLKIAINAGPEGDAVKKLALQYPKGQPEIIDLPYQSLREQLVTVLADKKPDFDVVMVDDPWFPMIWFSTEELGTFHTQSFTLKVPSSNPGVAA